MSRARVAIDAAVLAAAVWIDRLAERNIGRTVARDDGTRAIDVQGRLQLRRLGLVRRDGRCGQRFEIRFPFVARESPLLVR